jgi:5'-nucleotidase
MKVLVTNDDGVHAEGLRVLAEELRREHSVCIFAPDQERSGVSHAMSLRSPGKVKKLGDGEYSCSGTPADCVILAALGAIPFQPDVVVAGINRGPNLGTDIIYSGTCGAARQASLHGLPAVAVSCAAFKEPLRYLAGASFVRRHLARLVAACLPGSFLNLNAPSSDSQALGARWAFPSRRRYNDKLVSFEGPDGYSYCFLSDTSIETFSEAGSDHDIVSAGDVAISQILSHPQAAPGNTAATRWPA